VKVLGFTNFFFKLPDDFSGTFNDALLEYVKYRKENNLPKYPGNQSSEIKLVDEAAWNDFLEALDEGKNANGGIIISQYEDGEWSPLT
jgi:hypothetical protein